MSSCSHILQDLGLPDSGLVERVLLFNVGVELGQLTAFAIIVGVGTLLVRWLHPDVEIRKTAFIALVGVGLVAAALISFPASDSSDTERVSADGQETSCAETISQPTPMPGGGHPEKTFFAAGERAPEEDLAQVLGDGYVIVRYRSDLAPKHTQALQNWAEQTDPPYQLEDPALWDIVRIVHEADLEDERYDAPEARGLDVLIRGLSLISSDEQMLELTGPMYDSLYEHRRRAKRLGRDPS